VTLWLGNLEEVKLSKVALRKLLRQLHMGNLGSVERLSVVVIVISVSYPFVRQLINAQYSNLYASATDT
jgi:hypothetical protein